MAKETTTRLVDDLDGGAAHETIRFSLDSHLYEIDLSTKNAKKLRNDLATYVAHGNRIANSANGRTGRTPAGRPNGTSPNGDQNRAIREWAQSKGYEISARGRIKQGVVDEFHRSAGR
jgi:Lsr2